MSGLINEAIAAKLHEAGAVPREQDLYSGSGTDFYERLVGPDRAEIREVLALARDVDGPVLDVAAGSGRVTIPLVRSGKRVTAIDLSEDMLAHLRRALPEHPLLDCVVADMRDFDLGRLYDLVIIGATSITLLDRAGRSSLYASIRRHLTSRGVLAFTVASGSAAAGLAVPMDREITVPGIDGDESYVFSQQMDEGGAARVVNWVRSADLARGGAVTVLTSRLLVLDHAILAAELVEEGFVEPTVSPVRTPLGDDIVLLVTTVAESPDGVSDLAGG